jgi:hypothetical protein
MYDVVEGMKTVGAPARDVVEGMKTVGAPAREFGARIPRADNRRMPDESGLRAELEAILETAATRAPVSADDAAAQMRDTHAAIRRVAAARDLPLHAVRGSFRQAADLLRAETTAASAPLETS